MRPTNLASLQFSYTAISILAVIVLAALVFNVSAVKVPFQKQLANSAFGIICVLGIIAGLYPARCAHLLRFDKTPNGERDLNGQDESRRFEGHHPTCGNFSSHVIRIGDKLYCAGCMGLVTGAIIALAGVFLYAITESAISQFDTFAFWFGLVGVALGLSQYTFFKNRSGVHFTVNVIFVVGAFSLLVGVNEINGGFILDLYLLVLVIYWVVARSGLSRLEHKIICSLCKQQGRVVSCKHLVD